MMSSDQQLNYSFIILIIIIIILIYVLYFKCTDDKCTNLMILKPWRLVEETDTGAILKRKCINKYFFIDACKKVKKTMVMKRYIEES